MKRREFVTWVGVGGVASCLPAAIAACSSNTKPSETATNSATSGEFAPVGTLAELEQKGQILNEKFAGGAVLVIRNPTAPNTITAINPTCTHAGCTVNWEPGESAFVCPCHASKFATDGKVLQEPADKPLDTYEAKIEGNNILIKGKA